VGQKTDQRGYAARQTVIPFAAAGYVALYEIASSELVLVLAVRHQLEEDYRE